MKNDRRIIVSGIYIILGMVLFALGLMEIVDAFWNGMGAALIVVGVIRLAQFFRFRKDEAYREKMETETSDERNRFIRNKAWAWSGYLFVIIAAVSTIVFRVMGQELISRVAGFAICVLLILYWGSYLVLQKKY